MRRTFALLILSLAVALLLAMPHPATTHAEGSPDSVQSVDLALMALPLDALPAEFAALRLEAAGFDLPADRQAGEINGYVLQYSDQSLTPGETMFVVTGPALFTDSAAASTALATIEQDAAAVFASMVSTPLTDLGDEAVSIVGNYDLSEDSPQVTAVLFRIGRLAGEAVIYRDDSTDVKAQAETIAHLLLDRMKGVVAGTITETSAPIPPDVNCSGDVDPVDSALLLQLGAGLVPSLDCGALGDANRDGMTNSIDSALILQYSAGLLGCLPTGTPCPQI